MFVLTTVTRDCKNGDLYVSVDDNAYLTKEESSIWQLKKRSLFVLYLLCGWASIVIPALVLRAAKRISIISSRSMSSNISVTILRKARNVIQVRIPKREQKSFSFLVNTNTTRRPIPDSVPTVLRSFR